MENAHSMFNQSGYSTDLNSVEYDHFTIVVYMNIISVQESFMLYDRLGGSVVFNCVDYLKKE